jgi:RNA polymerase-binding transcription factor DksA
MPVMETDAVTLDPQEQGRSHEAPATEAELVVDEASDPTVDAVDQLLDEVERALSALDDGTYGRCSSCGEVIDDSVLEGSPTAQHCGPCDEVASA